MKKQDYINAIVKADTSIKAESLEKLKVAQLKAKYKAVTTTPEEALKKACNLASNVDGKAYDDAITMGDNAEKAMAKMTRDLLSPVFIAKAFNMGEEAVSMAFKSIEAVADKIAELHPDKDVKNNHMSKLRVNLDRGLKGYNAKEAELAKEDNRKPRLIEEGISVKARNNTKGKIFDVSFKARAKSKAVDKDANKVEGTVIELAIPQGIDALAKCKHILQGLQSQLGNGKNELFADAEGKPLSLQQIAELLLDSVDAE